MTSLRGSTLVIALCWGCGGSPPAAAPLATAKSEVPAPEPAPDLSPVSMPAEVVFRGRLLQPRTTIETLSGWAGLPVSMLSGLPEVRELDPVLMWDAPLEAAGMLEVDATAGETELRAVASFGLRSADAALVYAREQGREATKVAPGVFRVLVDSDVVCAIAPSLGSAPARLVCGHDWDSVERLLPYATRGLPREALGARELELEFRAAPLQRRYTQELDALRVLSGLVLRKLETDHPRFDRALTSVVYALADEVKALAHEVELVQIGGDLVDAGPALEIGTTLTLRGRASFVGQSMREAGPRAAVAPEVFWTLPADGTSGSYGIAGQTERQRPLAAAIAELADAYLEHLALPERIRRRVKLVLGGIPDLGAAAAYVSGNEPKAGNTSTDRLRASLGWSVGVLEQPAELVTRPLDELAALIADAEVRRQVEKRLEIDKGFFPKIERRAVRVPGFTAGGSAYALVLPGALVQRWMPQGSGEPTKAGKKPPAPKPFTAWLVLVPDRELTWASFGTDRAAVLGRLEAAHAGRGKKLADLPGLEALRQKRVVTGGFMTPRAIAQYFVSWTERDVGAVFDRAPNGGNTPMLTFSEVTSAEDRVHWTGTLRVPKGVFEDATVAATGLSEGILSTPDR